MREIEDRLVQTGTPYRVIGGPRFYERAEIRDALAYLRATANPADDLAFERIVNVPKRGLADATLNALHSHARRARISLMEAARYVVETEELKAKPRASLRDLLAAFARWAKLAEQAPHQEVAQTILEESGYTDMWQRDRSADAAGRLENLKELVRSMEEFPDMGAFLEHVSLVMEANDSDTSERVSLMTLHAAEGPGVRHRVPARLGGRAVPLPALARRERPGRARGGAPPCPCRADAGAAAGQDLLRLEPAHPRDVELDRAEPLHRRAAGSGGRGHGSAGEFLLRPVALRPHAAALRRLLLRHAGLAARPGEPRRDGHRRQPRYRLRHGRALRRERERGGRGGFEDAGGDTPFPGVRRGWGSGPAGAGGGFGGRNREGKPPRGPVLIEGELVAKSTGAASAYAAGARVFHQKFGPGTVAGVDGNKLTVDFDKAGRKMVLDSFVQGAG